MEARNYDKGSYILTDDKAPVELLGMQVIDEMIKEADDLLYAVKAESKGNYKFFEEQD